MIAQKCFEKRWSRYSWQPLNSRECGWLFFRQETFRDRLGLVTIFLQVVKHIMSNAGTLISHSNVLIRGRWFTSSTAYSITKLICDTIFISACLLAHCLLIVHTFASQLSTITHVNRDVKSRTNTCSRWDCKWWWKHLRRRRSAIWVEADAVYFKLSYLAKTFLFFSNEFAKENFHSCSFQCEGCER